MKAEAKLRGDGLAKPALILTALAAKNPRIRAKKNAIAARDLVKEGGTAGIIARVGFTVVPHGHSEVVFPLAEKRCDVKLVIDLIVREIGILTAVGKSAVDIERVIGVGRNADKHAAVPLGIGKAIVEIAVDILALHGGVKDPFCSVLHRALLFLLNYQKLCRFCLY
jgi:hypothetical protein